MVKELETGLWGRFDGGRQMARAVGLRRRSLPEEAFDQSVLERMERDDDEASSWRQHALGCAKAARQLEKLVVDVDAQRLEGARRGVAAVDLFAPQHTGDELRELNGAGDGPLAPPCDDGAGDGPGALLLAKVE